MVVIKGSRQISRRWLWCFFAFWFLFLCEPVLAVDVPLRSIAQLRVDDDGRQLNYPVAVFYDPGVEEIYLVNGGSGRIVVYGPDFFPRVSVGSGRGVTAPRGGTVQSDGKVFVVQIRNYKNPTPRVTVLNGAFFVDMDISLDDIPEADGFIPRELAISPSGLMYLSGDNNRGVLVLDDEGYFLRWLKPTDEIINLSVGYKPEEQSPAAGPDGAVLDATEEDEDYANIPEEFRPRTARQDRISTASNGGVGPVKVNYIDIDSQGRIYMVSPETGKIYVYGPDENFLFSFGTKGGSPGQMSQPRALAIDEEHELIYVVDFMRHTILVYNLAGEFLFEVGGRGTQPGWFNFPSDMAINKRGEIIVADLFNRRVQVLEVGFKESFFSLEDILAENAKEDAEKKASQKDGGVGVQPDVELEAFDLVPGIPDIDYEKEKELGAGVELNLELSPDPDHEPEIEIEVIKEKNIFETPGEEIKAPESQPSTFQESSNPEVVTVTVRELTGKYSPQGEDQPDQNESDYEGKEAPEAGAGEQSSADKPELLSKTDPHFSKVETLVDHWVSQWEGGNVEGYLACYSRDYSPAKMDRDQWVKLRTQRIRQNNNIRIEIRDIKIYKSSADRMQVEFVQEYKSENYADVTLKTFELNWENDGWKIARENALVIPGTGG